MSARKNNIVKLPERTYRPNLKRIFAAIDMAGGDPGALYDIASIGLRRAGKLRAAGNEDRETFQGITDALTLSALALMTFLGVPRESQEDALP
jgi:hypothetical protein